MTTRLWKALIPLVVILLLVVGALYVVKSQVAHRPQTGGESTAEIKVGGKLPDFELSKFGQTDSVKASQLKAKVMLINFWATWCEACMVEMPSIVELRRSFKDRGFDVLAINVDENPGAVLPKVIQQLKMDFPVYLDQDQKLADLFDVHAIPFSVIINKEREILFIENGSRDWNSKDVRTQIERWLAS